MIEPVESCVLTEMDAVDPIVLSTCEACCTILLPSHMLFPPVFSTPTTCVWALILLDQGYMSDQASGGL